MKKNKKGFTLIEIIVVVVILAVLMAVAVPSVLKYIDEADNAKYLALTRAINEEVSIYISKEIAGKKGNEFKETIKNKLIPELSFGSNNQISKIISTQPFSGEQIYSIDCCFDGKYSENGWDYDDTIDNHTLTKISIRYCEAGNMLGNKDVKFVVTLLNKSMYYYAQDEIFDEIDKGTEKAPIWPLGNPSN